ncbi:sodium/solute symporter [Streptomyces alkaliterrae]|uniref:Cation acetate symporter n=1 Tax=Streptomyces alkaliterrae TaxID=2213162 RepID=A0A5P0YMR4_9ACTN|nr:cation acetate symporter [Streptomyces alkaliterrae]MBB1254817.1 cation acetate symporter [Streptomyces alkaliterrae]MBB1261506.1 cation acetate symporter [Streptomyces alkaliterrae]MQS01210.1 cation acetate symporter [Streptomyces alkaliterrae]
MTGLLAIGFLVAASLLIGVYGVRAARTAPDFLVASRRVGTGWNAMAIAGEYVSAASVLGLAGLLLKNGVGTLWFAVGFTAGYVAVVALVAGPMRRSGAYTVPDFAEYRLASPLMRRLCGLIVLVIMWLYLVPQFKGAGVVLQLVSGTPYWVGVVLAGLVVSGSIAVGGMRSATYVQAFHYLVKLAFVAVPAVYVLVHVGGEVRAEALTPVSVPEGWSRPLLDINDAGHPLLATWSVLLATTLGAIGLPHVIMRFHTSPSARAARRVAVGVIALLGVFYLFPAVYGLLGRVLTPHLVRDNTTDTVSVVLPGEVVPGTLGSVLTALVAAGAFAAFLSTSSGLLLALAGGLSHDLFGDRGPVGGLSRLRTAVAVGALVAVLLSLPAAHLDINVLVGWAFAVAASTFCPLLVLGIWWPRLTVAGAASGLIVGGVSATGAALASAFGKWDSGLLTVLLAQPASWTVPLAFAVMIGVSRRGTPPEGAERAVLRLHAP